ncbi:MAG: sulfite exporter TauE/SafE family protein [Nitrososphaerales archaeon]
MTNLLGISPIISVGTDLVHAFLMKSVGSMQHYEQKNIDISLTKYLALGAIPASFFGAMLTNYFGASNVETINIFVKLLLALILIVIGPILLLQDGKKREIVNQNSPSVTFNSNKRALAYIIGVFIGILVSMTSVGGGVLLMPFLILFFSSSPHKAVGTNIFFAALLTLIPGMIYLYAGKVDLQLLGFVTFRLHSWGIIRR